MDFAGNSGRIETLGGHNYYTWKLRMQGILVKNKVWAYVSGTKPKPTPAADAPTEGELAAIAAWEEEDFKARTDLYISINNTELKQVKK